MINKNNVEDSENNEMNIILTPDMVTISSQSSLNNECVPKNNNNNNNNNNIHNIHNNNNNNQMTTNRLNGEQPNPGQNVDPIHIHEVLAGVTVFIHKRLSDQTAELQAIAIDLGAQYSWQLDSSVTHLIYRILFNSIALEELI
jgi:hypothetical protein